jgi:hypothetical protein
MKKLEKLNKNLIETIENFAVMSLSSLIGGAYIEYTNDGKTCDVVDMTGTKGQKTADSTDKYSDYTTTDCSKDHAIAYDPNGDVDSISSQISTSVAF